MKTPTLLFCLLIAGANCVAAPLQENGEIADIKVAEIQLESKSGLIAIKGYVKFKLKFTNTSDKAMKLDLSQFQFFCNGKIQAHTPKVSSPLLGVPRTVEAGGGIEGNVGMELAYSAASEPSMELIWQNDEAKVVLSINEAIRKVTNLRTRLTGPQQCLAVVEIDRPVDNFSVWQLTEEFQRLQQTGIRRVVLVANGVTRGNVSYAARATVSNWLKSVREGAVVPRFTVAAQPKSSVQFPEFFVAGLGTRDPSGYLSRGNSIFAADVHRAVAAALQSKYETIELETAMLDINGDEPGVVRAAVAANIDRMNDAEMDQLLKKAMSGSAALQTLIAANLRRVSSPAAVSALATFCRSTNAEVSGAAIISMVNSVSPSSVVALRSLWHESESSALRHEIVKAIKSSNDYRHASLMEEYAEALITDFSQAQPSVETSTPPAETPAKPAYDSIPVFRTPGKYPNSSQSTWSRVLKSVLDYLREHESSAVADVARDKLLQIADPGVQDVVLDFVMQNDATGDTHRIADQYIDLRLTKMQEHGPLTEAEKQQLTRKYGPRGHIRKLQITSTLMSVIRRFPDPAYTDRLVQLSKDEAIGSSMRRTAFSVAVNCATDSQLETMINQFHTLDRYGKEYLLKEISTLDYHRWLRLAKECMNLDEGTQGLAIGSLVTNGSVEAMTIVVSRLTELIEQAVRDQQKTSTSDLSPGLLRPIDKLLKSLRDCRLPEARRVVNLCERSSIVKLNELALNAARESIKNDPNRATLVAADQLRRSKQYVRALKQYDVILQADPFCSRAYSGRSSMHSRLGRPQSAIDDLQKALELEPEDALIESLLALAEVEAGRAEKGIRMMEDVLESIPDLPTYIRRDALYNLGCAYGRALDQEKDEALRKKYMKRGMEVLRDCVERENGWNETLHVKDDPDVNAFRNHPEWTELMDRVEKNERNSRIRR